jgi:hypothetical protein
MLRVIAAGVLALELVAGCMTIPPTPRFASATISPTTSLSQTPQTTLAPTPAPSPAVVCQIVAADCEEAIELVRAQAPSNVVSADTIVVADICPPEVTSDRVWAFDSIVAFVRAGSLMAAYEVTGVRGPEVASRVVAPLPEHIEALIRDVSPTP